MWRRVGKKGNEKLKGDSREEERSKTEQCGELSKLPSTYEKGMSPRCWVSGRRTMHGERWVRGNQRTKAEGYH